MIDGANVSRYIVIAHEPIAYSRQHRCTTGRTAVDGHRDRSDDEGHESLVREFLHDLRRGGRSAVRRGDVRPAILAVLEDEPMHGYQVIRVLEERSRGHWRPSAGSVYPTLQQLQDEGLVRSEEIDGRRTYSLTDEGRTQSRPSTPAARPW